MKGTARLFLLLAVSLAAAVSVFADEIKLKDGKKLYGVIVGYEDNMFRIKTDFGFVLVEKDKISAIVPNGDSVSESAPAAASGKAAAKTTPTAKASAAEPAAENRRPKISDAPVKPSQTAATAVGQVTPPAIEGNTAAPNSLSAIAQASATPKEPEPPAPQEEVLGTQYTNFSHGFRMYKAPSWELIEDARQSLPNAIVAMGTANQSTLMVVGEEKSKDTLAASAAFLEKRLREIYTNYRPVSQRNAVVGGAPAVEYKYRGTADEHNWSGTLVVISRGKDLLTMLGMTYADSDLIQIQENVIARAIASTSFNVPKYSAEK